MSHDADNVHPLRGSVFVMAYDTDLRVIRAVPIYAETRRWGPVDAPDDDDDDLPDYQTQETLYRWRDGWILLSEDVHVPTGTGNDPCMRTLTEAEVADWQRRRGYPPEARGPSERDADTPLVVDDGQALALIPGGFRLRGHTTDLTGDAWAVLERLLRNPLRRVTRRALLETVWGRRRVVEHQVNVVVGKVRQALVAALRKAGVNEPDDPLPPVDRGLNLAWELRLPKI